MSGEWFGEKGLSEVEVKDLSVLSRLEEIPPQGGFLILSYDLTGELLGVPVKRSIYPSLLFLRIGKVRSLTRTPAPVLLKPEGATLTEREFRERIGRVKDYIEKGDVYQINLTCGFTFSFRGNPLDIFLRFFYRQPVPFAFFLDAEDFFLMSGSMELFLKKEGSRVESRPIKGTGKNPEDILASEKERAENLMITDMMRNDIGKVAKAGSVRVRELFRVERYRTLCQMLSVIEGETEKRLPHILRHTFPPASVTGAPKRRAVEIIEQLEPHPRGYYCGAAGFVKENGDFTLSVLIRTAYGGGKQLTYFAGCGIVWDSDPFRETEELLLKVKAFYNR